MSLRRASLVDLVVRGERAFRVVPVYSRLKACLHADDVHFLVAAGSSAPADRVLFLNLTFWHAGQNSDVLVDTNIDADVVAHAAWHHAAQRALATGSAPTPAALFLGESVASAFDLYVVGRMLRTGRQTAFLRSQVPLMSAACGDAGLADEAIASLFTEVAEDPETAFRELRELLFDASLSLFGCVGAQDAVLCLDRFESHRFAGLLHHFALSSWVLYARAYAGPSALGDPAAAADHAMRAAPDALRWLEDHWLSEG